MRELRLRTGTDAISNQDLESIDHFHSGGRGATQRLLELAKIDKGERVLDIGGCIGGAARLMIESKACEVTVLDIIAEYCYAGESLASRLSVENANFVCGDALHLPFTAEAFDVIWMQHVTMNIADRKSLLCELSRVLKPGGRIAFQEVFRRAPGLLNYPVPWARNAKTDFSIHEEDGRALLSEAGLEELCWDDFTAQELEKAINFRKPDTQSTSQSEWGIGLLLAEGLFSEMGANVNLAIRAGVLRFVRAVYRKPN